MAFFKSCLRNLTYQPELPLERSQLASRWLVLTLLCSCLFGSYYVYDNPTAVEVQLESYLEPSASGGNSTDASSDDDPYGGSTSAFPFRYNMLYSVYSWPNVILPFLGGFISDVLGVRLMMVVFVLLITLGQLITAFGCTLTGDAAWYTMWLGRMVFGFGGESLSVAQSAMIAQWFAGKELAFALGLNLALARVGSVVNDAVSVQIATHAPVYYAFWAGFVVCVASTVTGIWCYYVDQRAEDLVRTNNHLRPAQHRSLLASLLCVGFWKAKLGGGSGAGAAPSAALPSSSKRAEGVPLLEDAGAGAALDPAAEEAARREAEVLHEPPKEELHMGAVFKFPLTFWLLTVSCICVYVCVLCFNNFASAFVAQKFLVDQPLHTIPSDSPVYVTANTYMLTTYLVAGFLAPFMGGLFDRIGMRAVATCGAAVAIVGVHAVMAFTQLDPVVPLVFLGVCYSIYASALWPSVALVTEPKYHATAYGVVTAVQNLGLAVVPLLVGNLQPSKNCPTYDDCVTGYVHVEELLMGFGALGIAAGLCLNAADFASKVPVLNWSHAKASAAQEENAAAAAAAATGAAAAAAVGTPSHPAADGSFDEEVASEFPRVAGPGVAMPGTFSTAHHHVHAPGAPAGH